MLLKIENKFSTHAGIQNEIVVVVLYCDNNEGYPKLFYLNM